MGPEDEYVEDHNSNHLRERACLIDIFICVISETGQLGSMKINKTEGEGGKYPEKDKRAKRTDWCN